MRASTGTLYHPAVDPFGALVPGSIFARDFRVIRPLSAGGMGAVYVAEQLSTGKERALKLMRAELVALPELRERFEREAKLGALIESDHVVEVIGAGVDEATGMPWLAMELLSGRDLEAHVSQTGPLHPHTVLVVFEQLCHALGAAHRRGVIHRDLKLENIFLATPRRADVPFTVKILDFGIAKVLAEAKTRITAAVGTPLWMSPEQSTAGAPITPASDVWALGLIAFRLLTGKIYWKTAHVAGASTIMLMRELLMDELPRASVRAAELGGAALPVGFDDWFARCVERDPTKRFSDANEALESLRPVLQRPADATGAAFDGGAAPVTGKVAPTVVTTLGAHGDLPVPPRSRATAPYWVLGALALLASIAAAVFFTVGSSSKGTGSKAKSPSASSSDDIPGASAAAESAEPRASLVSVHVGSSAPEVARDTRLRDGKWLFPKLDERAGAVSSCYVEALGRNAQLTGELKIEIDIDDTGAITAYQPDPFLGKDGELAKCIEAAFSHFYVVGTKGRDLYIVTAWNLSRSASAAAAPTYELEVAGAHVDP